jgi:hypothetical protein
LIEQDHRPLSLDLVEAGLGQGIGLDHDALVDSVGPGQAVEVVRLDDLRGRPGAIPERLGEPLGGVAGQQHAPDASAGVGQGGERAVRTEKQVGTRLVMQRTRRAASIASAGSLMRGLFLSHPASYIGGTPA